MARKYDFISELYNRTCKTVVANSASWEAFLRSACYNYRLRFDEQLLVHAQRPDATAVLQIDDWNQKFGRWVNRGAHGIAVFEDADQRRQRLVHYFDISDTHPSRFSRRVPIWQMRDEYTAEVIDTLESTFGELNDKETLAVAIESAARNAVEDNIPDYLPDLIYSVKDSFLDGVSEEEITHIFKTAVRNSVAYMTMTRLGIEAGEYFEPDDLRDVVNFTTPATLNALGYATSDIAEMGLAEISRTILSLDRQNRIIAEKTKADYNVGKEKTERSPDDERDHLHEAGGLSAPRSDNAGTAGAVDGQVRPDAEEVPEGASQGTLLQPADELRPERASERHGAQSERDGTDADGADGGVGGRDGEPESDGYDELGSEDEQHPEPSAGDRDDGGNLRLDYYDRSHEDKSLPFFGGDDTVREILGTTPHLKASKDEIRAFFEATADEDARISYIKRIFNNDYTEVILSDGRRVGYKTYQNVLQLWEGSYLSRTAQSFYDWGVIAQHFEAMWLLGELQDTMKPLPSIDGQLSLMTAGAEERKPSAFTFSQEIIDAVLTRGSGISEGKMRIYEQFHKSLSAKENADFLKNEYGWGGAYPVIVGAGIDEQHDGKGIRISKGIGSDKPHIDLKWSQVEKRIAELIKLDRYLNPKEKAQYPEWLQKQEERRAALTEERRNREILSTAPSEKTEPENERYEYHLGSTVYLGANEYEILSFDDERVMLYDTQFPLFNKEMTRAEFDSKVQENPLNDHLKVANKLNDQSKKDDTVTFEELGVDRLFIDESHYYKNLFLFTKMRNVGGIAQTEAMKSSDLFMKCRYLDELTGGRGVVFATGTPISNSMVELYTIQRYLQYNTLVQNNLQHFDAWASTFGETITAVELTPEGTGYRAKTRFARFYNLPELMAMFKEIADIKTADMLDLPVPKAVFHNISVKPSEIQRDMVAGLAERAERVRNGMVDARVDNMLKITNDGRKLALDQRLINPLLPDFEDSKLNACVDAMFETWERGSEKRLTQLFFCDLSTPKNDGSFNVYDDIRQKLIARGVPADEIKFIHEADTEAKKLELFKKVRRGDVRILMGSTQKMGAGTNVQNKLAASSDLDCPWRPSDLEQRLGRSIRQGNENAEVHIYRFVTEETFDAYLYQLVEGKQKFASQIMTSKSPVRSCEDIDETALSYAEIKMLATGNPHIKEKMDLDIQVQKLRLLKSSFLSEKYALEDKIIKFYPQEIARRADVIAGLKSDIERVAEHPKPSDETFVGMTVKGAFYSEKADAGNAILEACKAMTNPEPIPLGEYRGFTMELYFEAREYKVRLKGELAYPVTLGTDTFGNITRLDNALEGLPKRLEMNEMELDNIKKQFETAKVDVERPFPQEEELKAKTDRLNELNALLNVDKRENEIVGGEPDEGEEPPEKKPRDLER